jgi:hypothetical protein
MARQWRERRDRSNAPLSRRSVADECRTEIENARKIRWTELNIVAQKHEKAPSLTQRKSR